MRKVGLVSVVWALACSGLSADEAPRMQEPNVELPVAEEPGVADPAADEPVAEPGLRLRPESDLTRACHGWPSRRVNRRNHAQVGLFLKEGEPAIDFTLRTPDGEPVHLAELLQTKPVLLLGGSYTCWVFQGKKDGMNDTAAKYRDDVHTVMVYTMEGHPSAPNPSIYFGKPKPREYSDRADATTWIQRAVHARDMEMSDDVQVVVDDLNGAESNPFWCSYGTCPNCSFLVAQDGTFAAVHEWHDRETMERSIDVLLGN